MTVWKTAWSQKRPYLDLGDAVAAIAHVIARNHYDNRVYNVVTQNYSVSQIVEAIRGHRPELRVNLVESQTMNDLSYDVSAERFTSTGFTFEGSLEKAVSETLGLLGGLANPSPSEL